MERLSMFFKRGAFKWNCMLMLAISSYNLVCAQRVQYSRQNFTVPYFDATRLVAGIGGYHQVLTFTLNRKTAIHAFDEKLQLAWNKKFDLQFTAEFSNITTVRFKDYYILSMLNPRNYKRKIWRISADGDAVDFSEKFQQVVDTSFKNLGTLQLVNQDNHLFLIAEVFLAKLGKMVATVVKMDKDFEPLSKRMIGFPFNPGDGFRRITLFGENVMVLKTAVDDSTGNSLQLAKGNLNTGKLFMNDFSSGSNRHTNANFRYNAEDTSFLIYSLVRNTVFMSKLDTALNYKAPVYLIKNQFSDRVNTSFLFLPGQTQQCISLSYGNVRDDGRVFTSSSQNVYGDRSTFSSGPGPNYLNRDFQRMGESSEAYTLRVLSQENSNARILSNSTSRMPDYTWSRPYDRDASAFQPPLRLAVLNKQFALLKDSLISNTKKTSVQLRPTANLVINNKSYLIFNQNLTLKKRGLLMVRVNDSNEIAPSDLIVVDKYEYLLDQCQSVNQQYAIMPYTHRREVGLLKISIDE